MQKLDYKTETIDSKENYSLILTENIIFYNKNKTIHYISFIKIISSYGVITLHINDFWNFNNSKRKYWIIENMYETLFYYSVPFFVLCIGATLLDFKQRYGLFEYNKRRFVFLSLFLLKIQIKLGSTHIFFFFYLSHNHSFLM